jgi:hypothetical protein
MNPAPARVAAAFAEDGGLIGFLVMRQGLCLAVDLEGQEFGPFRVREAAVAALSRRRRFEMSRRREVLPSPTPEL